ncbi:MAG: Sir2 family NAD-dependent protein deacetylase [Hyphomicrobiales bacterium]
MSLTTPCPVCHKAGFMRPDVVWFGEMPREMEHIYEALGACDLFVSVGTSGTVYPAHRLRRRGQRTPAPTRSGSISIRQMGASLFEEAHYGEATKVVPAYVETLLRG